MCRPVWRQGAMYKRENTGEIMKYSKIIVMTAVLAAGALSGCAIFSRKPMHLNVSPTIPAAEGSILFESTENGNTGIYLTVRNLANPEKLTSPANVYVVWVNVAVDATPQNIGALVVGKDLAGELRTVTPLSRFELFITAEPSAEVKLPSGQSLLWTSYTK